MRRAAITLGIGLVVLSPLAMRVGWDDFPISSYPMFSRGNLAGTYDLDHALVVYRDGRRAPARPSDVGSPEPMVAMLTVTRAVRAGTTRELCPAIAKNITDREAVSVEIVSSRWDEPRSYFRGQREPKRRTVHVSCPVHAP